MFYFGLLSFVSNIKTSATPLIYSFSAIEVKSLLSKKTNLYRSNFMLEEYKKSSLLCETILYNLMSFSSKIQLDSNNTNVKKAQPDSTLLLKNPADTTQIGTIEIDSTETSSHNYRPIIITYPRGYDKNRNPRYKLSGRVKYIKQYHYRKLSGDEWVTIAKLSLLAIAAIVYLFK